MSTVLGKVIITEEDVATIKTLDRQGLEDYFNEMAEQVEAKILQMTADERDDYAYKQGIEITHASIMNAVPAALKEVFEAGTVRVERFINSLTEHVEKGLSNAKTTTMDN